jgi:hypothetical protein
VHEFTGEGKRSVMKIMPIITNVLKSWDEVEIFFENGMEQVKNPKLQGVRKDFL